jgi:hypothetical protein
VSGSGNWEADNVSASPNGTALFDIEVYGPGSGPPGGTPIASVVVDQPQPAQVVLMSYSGTRSEEWAKSDPCNSGSNSGKDGDNVRWSYDQGGFLRQWASADEQQQNPP